MLHIGSAYAANAVVGIYNNGGSVQGSLQDVRLYDDIGSNSNVDTKPYDSVWWSTVVNTTSGFNVAGKRLRMFVPNVNYNTSTDDYLMN